MQNWIRYLIIPKSQYEAEFKKEQRAGTGFQKIWKLFIHSMSHAFWAQCPRYLCRDLESIFDYGFEPHQKHILNQLE